MLKILLDTLLKWAKLLTFCLSINISNVWELAKDMYSRDLIQYTVHIESLKHWSFELLTEASINIYEQRMATLETDFFICFLITLHGIFYYLQVYPSWYEHLLNVYFFNFFLSFNSWKKMVSLIIEIILCNIITVVIYCAKNCWIFMIISNKLLFLLFLVDIL